MAVASINGQTGVVTVEAEDIIATGFVEENQSVASGGEVASLFDRQDQTPGKSGTLSYTFEGADGLYDLALVAHDEHDGESPIQLRINGVLIDSQTLNLNTTVTGSVNNNNRVTLDFGGLELETGDTVEISASQEGGEWVRLDTLTFTPTPEVPVSPTLPTPSAGTISVEAEDIISSGFVDEAQNVASNDAVVSLFGASTTTGVLSYTFAGGAGVYNLDVITYDEDDGESSVTVRVNGSAVGAFDMDVNSSTGGSVRDDNRYIRTIEGLDLEPGDVVTVTVNQDGTEWGRIDRLDFVPQGDVSPTPDNIAPDGDIADQTLTVGQSITLNLDDEITDADNDALSYSLSGSGAAFASINGSILTISPDAGDEGAFSITITADDGTDTTDVTFSVSVASDSTPTNSDPITVEAEDIIDSDFLVENKDIASGGAVVSLFGASGTTGVLRYTFEGGDGNYDLALTVHDENDGAGTIQVRVNGQLVDTFTLDSNTTVKGSVVTGNRTVLTISDLDLETGDIIQVTGSADGGEWSRIDKLEFTPNGDVAPPSGNSAPVGDVDDQTITIGAPVTIDLNSAFTDADGDTLSFTIAGTGTAFASISGSTLILDPSAGEAGNYSLTVTAFDGSITSDASFSISVSDDTPDPVGASFTVEAEDIINSGYVVENKSIASGGAVVSLFDSGSTTGVLRYTFAGDDGTYGLDITVHDESDGAGTLTLRINGQTIQTVTLDDNTSVGGSVTNGNRAVISFSNLDLSTGDIVEVIGTADGGEWGRIDKLDFTAGAIDPGTGGNTAPTGTLADQAVAIGTPVVIDLDTVFSDADGDTLTFSIVGSGTAVASITGSTLTIDPQSGEEGDYSLTVSASDGEDTTSLTIDVAVTDGDPPQTGDTISVEAEDIITSGFVTETQGVASNDAVVSLFDAPSTTGVLTYTHAGGAGTFDLDITTHDENDGASTIQVRVNGQLIETLVMNLNTSTGGSVRDNNRFVQTVEDLDLNFGDQVTITVTQDGTEWGRIDKIDLIPTSGSGSGPVDPVNSAPVGDVGNQSITAGNTLTIDLTTEFTDADGDNLTFILTGSGTAFASISGSTLTISPGAGDIGDFSLTVTASDGTDSVSSTFDVAVTGEPSQGAIITLEAEDIIESGFVTENRSIASGGEVVSLFDAGTTQGVLSHTFAGSPGVYNLAIVAHDEHDGESTLTLRVNGVVVETFVLDINTTQKGSVLEANRITLNVQNLALEVGDVVEIIANQDGGEFVRIDKLDLEVVETNISPTGTPSIVITGTEDVATVFDLEDLLIGISDANGDTLTIENLVADSGILTDNLDGTLTLTTSANFNGDVTLSYDVTDGNGGVLATNVTIAITPVNDAPVANLAIGPQAAAEDVPFSITLPSNLFTDVDGEQLTIVATQTDGSPLPAWLSFNPATGVFSGTPAESDAGTINIRILATDSGNITVTREFDLIVSPVNDGPTGSPTAVITALEDVVTIITEAELLQGFTDVDNATISVENLSADQGTIAPNLDGDFELTTPPDFNGQVVLSYQVTDGVGGVTQASLTIPVAPVPDAPQGTPTAVLTGLEDAGAVIQKSALVEGFADADGDSLIAVNFQTDSGTIRDNGDGTLSLTTDENFSGPVTLSYDVADGTGQLTPTSTIINIEKVNDAPILQDLSGLVLEIDEDEMVDATPEELAAIVNAFTSDIDGDTVTISLTLDYPAGSGIPQETLTIDPQSTLNWTPPPDFFGDISITVTADDGQGADNSTVQQSVTLTVNPLNDAPTIGDLSSFNIQINEDEQVLVTAQEVSALVDSLISDVDGDDVAISVTLSFPISSSIPPETFTIDPNVDFTWKPPENFHGEISILVQADDGQNEANSIASATLSATVLPVNDAPVVSSFYAGALFENSGTQVINLLAGQIDVDTDQTLSVSAISITDNLNTTVDFTDNLDGTITIDPDQYDALIFGESRLLTINYTISDGIESASNTVLAVVIGEEDAAPSAFSGDASGPAEDMISFGPYILPDDNYAEPVNNTNTPDDETDAGPVEGADSNDVTGDAPTGDLDLVSGGSDDDMFLF